MDKQMKTAKKISFCGMFAALIFAFTMFVKIPVASGYVHLGDALVYVCAMLLGGPYAFFAAIIGEGLADIAGGYLIYFPATVIVKSLVVIPFVIIRKRSKNKLLTKISALMTLPAGLVTVVGYFLADLIIDKAYAIVDIPGNIIQAVGSAIIFIVVAFAFDKSKIIEKI